MLVYRGTRFYKSVLLVLSLLWQLVSCCGRFRVSICLPISASGGKLVLASEEGLLQNRWSRGLVVSGVVLSIVLLLRVSAVAAFVPVPVPVVVDPVFLVGVLVVFEGVGPFYIFVVIVVVVAVSVVVVCGIAIDLLHIESVPSLSWSPLLSPLLSPLPLLFLHS